MPAAAGRAYRLLLSGVEQGHTHSGDDRLEDVAERLLPDELLAREQRAGELGGVLGLVTRRQTVLPELSRQAEVVRKLV